MKTSFIIFVLCINIINVFAQNFAPAAEQSGSTAIYKDSSIIISWASQCTITRGFINISDTNAADEGDNRASYGNAVNALGKADNNVVSLGDNGKAILYFENPIKNRIGYDFVVFENAFNNTFLELAIIEVSSDGNRYVRFPSYSNTQTNAQIETFGELDPTYIHNLAGKYRANYGTPFDLEDIVDSSGIDLSNIHYVKIIDVVGFLDDNYALFDATGNKINDPWPTPFYNGGFDLDAVGVINEAVVLHSFIEKEDGIKIYPIPTSENITIEAKSKLDKVYLFNANGIFLKAFELNTSQKIIDLTNYTEGMYFIRINSKNNTKVHQIMKIN